MSHLRLPLVRARSAVILGRRFPPCVRQFTPQCKIAVSFVSGPGGELNGLVRGLLPRTSDGERREPERHLRYLNDAIHPGH